MMKQQSKYLSSFLVNNLLLLSGAAMVVSGLVLQIGFHVGGATMQNERKMKSHAANIEQFREIDPANTVWDICYITWTIIHKYVIVIFSLIMIYHIIAHWKWYKGVITKHLISKNKQVITLSVLFVLVALTGFIPWFIDLSGSKSIIRLVFIEIHDKLAIVLTIYLIFHIIKRVKWFSNTFSKMKNEHSTL